MRSRLLLCCLAALLAACSGSATGDTTVLFLPADERPQVQDVRGTTLAGDDLALADLPGPVVVNFWASWCGPCAEEMPDLVELAHQYEGRVSFLGIDIRDQDATARAFEADFGVPYPSLRDESGALAAGFGRMGPSAPPTTLILDADHRVALRWLSPVDPARFAVYLDDVLAEAA